MNNFTHIKIGRRKLAITYEGAVEIAKALKIPQEVEGEEFFEGLNLKGRVRLSKDSKNIEFNDGDNWIKILSENNGTYVTHQELNVTVQDLENKIELNKDKNFIFEPTQASTVWEIHHPLNKKCSVTVIDSAGTVIEGQVVINNNSLVVIHFKYPFSGQAILN